MNRSKQCPLTLVSGSMNAKHVAFCSSPRKVIMSEIVKDPVCHMEVPPASFATEYAGGHYAFCSAQCKERFLANPRVYLGFPGQKAPAQVGKQVIKRRRLLLSEPLDAAQAEQVKQVLLEMMGIHGIRIDENKIEIQYDLIQATAEQIADKLALAGASIGGGWVERLKLAFINNMEEIEISSLEVENKKCCQKP